MNNKNYYAFISYKRDDQKWAEWLQGKLEHYKLPTNLNGRENLPKEIRPVFRDKSELAAGVLADEIQKALENSKYLIVICSPHSAKSEWVNKEVQSFIDMGRADKIIPFIIEGVPNSNNDETECFPKAIRELPAEQELLGVNINEMGRDAAAVKVVAQMFGLRFDDLWNRHEREQRRRRHLITAGITAFALMMTGFAFWMYAQRQQTLKANWNMMEKQSRVVSEMTKSYVEEDSYSTRLVALEILPDDLDKPNIPYTPEAEMLLRESIRHNTAKLSKSDTLDDIHLLECNPNGEQFLFTGHYMRTDTVMSDGGTYYAKSFVFVCDTKTFNSIVIAEMPGVFSYQVDDICHYSPDGKAIMVYQESDSTLRMIDAETLEDKRVCKINGKYNCTQYFQDGSRIVFLNDSIASVFDVETGQELHSIKYPVQGVLLSGVCNGKILTMDNDTILSIISLDDGKMMKSFVLEDCHSFNRWGGKKLSPDGNYLACRLNRIIEKNGINICGYSIDSIKDRISDGKFMWQEDSTVMIIDLVNCKEMGKIYAGCYYGFSPDGKKVLSANDKTINIWDIENCEKIQSIITEDNVGICACSPDGEHLVYTTYSNYLKYMHYRQSKTDEFLKIINSKTGKVIKTINQPFYNNTLQFSPDGRSVLCGNDIEIINYGIDFGDDNVLTKYDANEVVMSYDNKLMAIKDNDTTINIIDVVTGKSKFVLSENHHVHLLCFSPKDKSFIYKEVYNNYCSELKKWHYESGSDTVALKLGFKDSDSIDVYCAGGKYRWITDMDTIRMMLTSCIYKLNYNNNGDKFVIVTFNMNRIGVFDAEIMTELKMSSLNMPPMSAIFNPEGKSVFVWKNDTQFEEFNMENDKRGYYRGSQSYGGICSSDGKYVMASTNNGFEVFSSKTYRLLHKVEGHTDIVNSIRYNPNEKYIVTASDDKTIRVWDTETWKCVDVLEGHTDKVTFASFTPDGKHIISASQDSTIRIWDFPPLQDLIDQTRERFKNRPLTEEERKMYYLE